MIQSTSNFSNSLSACNILPCMGPGCSRNISSCKIYNQIYIQKTEYVLHNRSAERIRALNAISCIKQLVQAS